ncbi:MAG: pantoate--beta-alanine ligase [Rickettsiales bacterium]
MTIVDNVDSLQKVLTEVAKSGKRVALVPTMGALHEGHLALIKAAKEHADFVVATIFVNPMQFGANEDFDTYPRPMEDDVKKLEAEGVSLIYAPSMEDMYPPGFSTTVSAGMIGEILDGEHRPGFFTGVATVVTKLLLRVLPHVAVFGEKDYQQLCVIRAVVYDMDMPIQIVGVPTVREADGLAMSSRNAYLSDEERKTAPQFHQVLKETAAQIESGAGVEQTLMVAGTKLTQAGFTIDYIELCESDNLSRLTEFKKPCRLIAAVRLGKTRLLDNIPLE